METTNIAFAIYLQYHAYKIHQNYVLAFVAMNASIKTSDYLAQREITIIRQNLSAMQYKRARKAMGLHD